MSDEEYTEYIEMIEAIREEIAESGTIHGERVG